jgi:ribonucleotide reductase beta subunit family protein with ferritin-like domain
MPTPAPVRYPDVWEFYKKAMASFWTVDEVDLGQDMRDWATLRSEWRVTHLVTAGDTHVV